MRSCPNPDHLSTVSPAVMLGNKGWKETTKRGPDYFRQIAALRQAAGIESSEADDSEIPEASTTTQMAPVPINKPRDAISRRLATPYRSNS